MYKVGVGLKPMNFKKNTPQLLAGELSKLNSENIFQS